MLAWSLAAALGARAAEPQWRKVEGEAFTFTKVRDGIWHAIAAGDTKRGRGYDAFIGSTPQTVAQT